MADLFKKLETLLRAQVNDTLPSIPQRKRGPSDKSMEDQVSSLRQRINTAIDHENALQAKVQRLKTELDQLDQQANEAIKKGDDATARHYLIQRERTEQRLQMAESDLEAHRLSAQELIQSVNAMDAAVADSQQNTSQPAPTEEAPSTVTENEPGEISGIVDLVQRTREQLKSKGKDATPEKTPAENLADPNPSTKDKPDDDDLDDRRQRLSRR